MPAGRPRNPAGAGEAAPVLYIRQTAEDEAALNVIRFEQGLSADPARRLTAAEAVRHAIRSEALRLAGQARLELATAGVLRRRKRQAREAS